MPPPTTVEDDADAPVVVGMGPNCEVGVVDASAIEALPGSGSDLTPINAPGDRDEVIGYWSPGIGWLTLEEVDAPDFDLDAYRDAAEAWLTSGPHR